MNWPTSQDYNEAVQDAANNFSDATMKGGEVVVNVLGLPVPRSGNFADVYQFKDGNGRMWALKCFTRKVAGLRERYLKIDEHLAKYKLPFTVGFKFMDEGIRVKGQWFPLLKMEWVEGFTLNDFVSENLTKPHYLHALMQMWAKLAGRLRDANMAHADLQHGNVLLVPGATPQKLGLKLIDYDGMWVPALSEFHSGEAGHPNFQHPLRLKDRLYNGDVDRFPHLVVAAGLRATLVGGKAIWDRFDNSDNLIFKESDLRDPAKAPVFKALWELNDPILRTLVGHIALSAKQPLRKTPWLDDVLFAEGGPKLTAEEEKQVCELLGIATQAVKGKGTVAAKVEQEFNVFEFLDEDSAEQPAERPARRLAAAPARKAKKPEKKSMAPLLIGGGAVAAIVVLGAILAISLGGKKEDTPVEVVQNKEDPKPKLPDRGTTTKKDPEEVKIPVKAKEPVPQPPIAPRAATIGVAAVSGGRDYLFIRQDDPTLYMTVNGSARKAREVGHHNSAIHSLAVSPDGSRAVTGAKDGEVRVWSLKENGAATADPRARMKTKIANFGKIDLFQFRYSHDVYQEGIVVHDHVAGKEQVVLAGKPGYPLKGAFKSNYEKEPVRFGLAMTEEVEVFDGDLVVQIFEGGSQIYSKAINKSWYAWHARRKPSTDSPVPEPASPLKTKIRGPTRLDNFKRPYEFTLYKEGMLIRDLDSNKEATVRAGLPVKESDPSFQGNFEYTRLAKVYGLPVSLPTEVFDGALRVVLCQRGFLINQIGTTRDWNLTMPKVGLGKEEPPKGEPSFALKNKLYGPKKIIEGDYEYTLYREGVHLREMKTGKQVTVAAGRVLTEVKGPFKPPVAAPPGSPFEHPVTEAIEVFDGVLFVQLFSRGVMFQEKGNPTRRYAFNAGEGANIGGTGDPPAMSTSPTVTILVPKQHSGSIVASAVSADGGRAVTVGKDRSLCEWDLVGSKLIRKFEVPESHSIAYLPDGKSVILCTENESAGVWELATGRRVTELAGHTGPVRTVCVSPNADMAWTGGDDGTIRVWFLPDFKRSGSVPGETGGVRSLAVSPNGRTLACVVADGSVRFFDTKTGQSAGNHAGKSQSLALSFLNDGELVAARNPDPIKVRVTRGDIPGPAENQEYQQPDYLTAARRRANLLVDGSFEEIPSKQWEPRSWRMNLAAATVVSNMSKSGKASALLRPTEPDDCMLVQKVAVKERTQYLLSGWVRTQDVTIDQESGRVGANLSVVGSFEASRSVVGTTEWSYVSLVFNSGERKEIEVGARLGHNGSIAKGSAWFDDIVLLELGADSSSDPIGKAKIVPKADPKPPAEMAVEHKEGLLKDSESLSDTIAGCVFSTDGKKIYASTHQGVVHVLDAVKLDEMVKFEVAKTRISQIALKPKTTLISGTTAPERLYLLGDNKQVHIWDPEKRTRVKEVNLDKVMAKIDNLDLMVVAPTESYLVGFDADRANSISWDLVRGVPGIPASLSRAPFNSTTRCVAFTPDCRFGTAYASGKLLVWNLQTGADIRFIDAPTAPSWLGLQPGASSVVAAGRNRLQAWNYTVNKQTLDVRDPHGRGGFATFHTAVSFKGDCFATAGNDRWLRIWDVRTGAETAKWQMDREPKGLVMSPDGKFAVTWHAFENKISLWGVGQTEDKKK